MKEITNLKKDWDDYLPDDIKQSWKKMIMEIVEGDPIVFPRKVVGVCHGNIDQEYCEVIGYWDGSQLGSCCALYLRWLDEMETMTWSS